MAPLGPLTTNRLTVRLDPERAARIEYWATENPLKIKSYNQAAEDVNERVWNMPLWKEYKGLIQGTTADLTNSPEGSFGGAITAALFLQEFIKPGTKWAHIDLMAWNLTSKPGRPRGGEAMAIRSIFSALKTENIF